jgi:hypothetical protein
MPGIILPLGEGVKGAWWRREGGCWCQNVGLMESCIVSRIHLSETISLQPRNVLAAIGCSIMVNGKAGREEASE